VQNSQVDIIRSGPWGVAIVYTTLWGGPNNFRAFGYAFPDTGSGVTVNSNVNYGIFSAVYPGMNELVSLADRSAGTSYAFQESYVKIVIGGDLPGHLYTNGAQAIRWYLQPTIGAPSPADPSNWTFDTNLPGAVFHFNNGQSYLDVDAPNAAPGNYYIHLKVDASSGWYMGFSGDLIMGNNQDIPGTTIASSLIFAPSNSVKTNYPAIHNTLPTSIVLAPAPVAPPGGMPFGIWIKAVVGPTSSLKIIWGGTTYWWSVAPINNGIWLSYACPLPTLTGELADTMPPNSPTDRVLPVEKLPAPADQTLAVQSASNATPIVVRVPGKNSVATNNRVYISGVSGNAAANGLWTVTFVGTGLTGSQPYTDFSLNGSAGTGAGAGGSAAITDQDIIPVQPSIDYRPTRFPSMRDTDTSAPVFTYANMSGICIYDVLVRRAPAATAEGVYLSPAAKPAQNVSLGCIRNGGFVVFQTVTIPAGQDEVRIYPCWPVFTANALVYQSSDRALVCALPFQTESITSGQAGSWGASSLLAMPLAYPITAQAVGDVAAILADM
jgi:hypothetical protein